jgi:hypothetical protein
MFKPSRLALILGLAGAMAGLPSLAVAQQDSDAAGVAEAIRFQKAEDAAAARQAHSGAARAAESNSADRMVPEADTKATPSSTARKESGVEAAIRFQRAEDLAAARQARIEAAREGESNSADRMAPTASPARKTRRPQQRDSQ